MKARREAGTTREASVSGIRGDILMNLFLKETFEAWLVWWEGGGGVWNEVFDVMHGRMNENSGREASQSVHRGRGFVLARWFFSKETRGWWFSSFVTRYRLIGACARVTLRVSMESWRSNPRFYGNDRELDTPRCAIRAKGCPGLDGSMFSFSIVEGIVREGC